MPVWCFAAALIWMLSSSAESAIHSVLDKDGSSSSQEPVVLTVYYEALCPDSRRFITEQLLPASKTFGQKLKVELKPFGKASWVDEREGPAFTCQHGPNECYGNIIQACIIEKFEAKTSLSLVSCLMSTPGNTEHALPGCASKLEISMDSINGCVYSKKGPELHKRIGQETKSLKPKLTYVPWVTFNGVFVEKDWNESLINLKGVLCRTYLKNSEVDCSRVKGLWNYAEEVLM